MREFIKSYFEMLGAIVVTSVIVIMVSVLIALVLNEFGLI